jgi:diacylglycerol kinase (ATP)
MTPTRPLAPRPDPYRRDEEGIPMQDETTEPESLHPRGLRTVPDLDATSVALDAPPPWSARAGRRNSREKFAAGLRGLKHAIRGDSSFFAHAYRGTLIALTAALLGVNIWGWCLLVIAACLVLLSELTHSAIDTLARAVGNPEEPRLKTVREIATAGVVVAAFASGAVTITVLTWKLGELLGWWS